MPKTIGLSLALLVVSAAAATAKETQPAPQQTTPNTKSKARPAAATGGKRHAAAHAERRSRSHARQHTTALPPPDEYLGPVQIVGHRELGSAAWYGGRHLGLRTASGERLDAVHATAAHRSLPLRSLVRVTNLSNGRSVIARINDRGPVSPSLLIDVSPRVADVLDMKRSGIVRVAVEPVAPAQGRTGEGSSAPPR